MSHCRYRLSEMGIVCALGADVGEVGRRLAAGDQSGMKPLGGLSGGESTFFGFAARMPSPATIGERVKSVPCLPRVGVLVDAAMEQLSVALEAAKSRYGAARVGAVVGTSNSTMEEFTDNPDVIDMSWPARRLRERWGVEGVGGGGGDGGVRGWLAFAACGAGFYFPKGTCGSVECGGGPSWQGCSRKVWNKVKC